MRTILITGGLGFVGGRLTKKIAFTEGANVIVSSRSTVSEKDLKKHGKIKSVLHADLLLPETFPKDIDTVIHLAGLNEWDCVRHPSVAIRVNIDETRILLENSIQAGVKNFIYFSTAHIYGSPLQGNIDEMTLPIPLHPYAITHKAAEDYIVAATVQKKIKGIVLRLSNSFGAPILPSVNRWTLLVNDLCRQAIEKGCLTLLSNGCQYRDFICLTDVENIVIAILERSNNTFNKLIYNLGSGQSFQVQAMAERIARIYTELFGSDIKIFFPKDAQPTNEPPLHFQIDKLLKEDVVLKNNFNEEIKQLLLFCKQNFTQND